MATGCVGPFAHGTGGFCNCNCGCCPPRCCSVISVYFNCGAPQSSINSQGCPVTSFLDPNDFLDQTPVWQVETPVFQEQEELSLDFLSLFGAGMSNCAVACSTTCVAVTCDSSNSPCCCLEIFNNKLLAVGNGHVTAPSTVIVAECQTLTVKLNGSLPPILVNDAQEIIVTITSSNSCCTCSRLTMRCAACTSGPLSFWESKPLWKKIIDYPTGKIKINPKTGSPMIVLDKKELLKRLIERKKRLRKK